MNRYIIIGLVILTLLLTGCTQYQFIDTAKNYYSSNLTVDEIFITKVVWDDLRFPAVDLSPGVANSPSPVIFLNNTYVLAFDDTKIENLNVIAQLPHSWREGSNILPHFHYTPLTNNSGDVVFCVEYTWSNIYEKFGPTEIKCSVDSINNELHYHLMTPIIILNGTNKTLSSMLNMRIFRDGSNNLDTFVGDVGLLEFDIHYQVYRFGE